MKSSRTVVALCVVTAAVVGGASVAQADPVLGDKAQDLDRVVSWDRALGLNGSNETSAVRRTGVPADRSQLFIPSVDAPASLGLPADLQSGLAGERAVFAIDGSSIGFPLFDRVQLLAYQEDSFGAAPTDNSVAAPIPLSGVVYAWLDERADDHLKQTQGKGIATYLAMLSPAAGGEEEAQVIGEPMPSTDFGAGTFSGGVINPQTGAALSFQFLNAGTGGGGGGSGGGGSGAASASVEGASDLEAKTPGSEGSGDSNGATGSGGSETGASGTGTGTGGTETGSTMITALTDIDNGYDDYSETIPTSTADHVVAVPEPGSLALLGLGLAFVGALVLKHRRRASRPS